MGQSEKKLGKIANKMFTTKCIQGLFFDLRKQRNAGKSDLRKLFTIFDSRFANCVLLR